MHTKRELHTATLLKNGQVLIAGGADITGPSLPAAELFTPGTGVFAPTGSMINARSWHTATLLNDGRVLVTGGWDASGNVPLNTAELFDPSTGMFTLTKGSMASQRVYHNAALLSNGMVLITGYYGEAELFDPLTETFTRSGGTYLWSRFGTATALKDGTKVLVIEFNVGPSFHHPNGWDELYDFSKNADFIKNGMDPFTVVGGSVDQPGRSRHTATLRNDGTVLVAGGGFVAVEQELQPPAVTASAELFDPVSQKFLPTDDMAIGREWHTATLLTNGDVLISGGIDAGGNPLAAAELYH